MCGICGEVRFGGDPVPVTHLQAMADRLAPRGPDAEGWFGQPGAALGHRRLSIIDLSDNAQQPMVDSDLGLVLVYNGAIYNYPDLRHQLEGLGYRFFSHGDSEVILKAYDAWGPACVERFNGMFAFAIWHRGTGEVFLARDRLGIKPLYYTDTRDGLRFASSLPALLAPGGVDTDIDPVALHHYLTFHAVVPAPRTILRGVHKLPAATRMTIHVDGRRTSEEYWSLAFDTKPDEARLSASDWEAQLHDVLKQAVQDRMVADVPVGVLLSGGLDSSLVVALLAANRDAVPTFSVGFDSAGDECGDEFEYSDLVARHFGTKHHKLTFSGEDVLGAMDGCVRAMSEPMVSHDCVGFYLLSRAVSEHVKVVQSGQGADELFAGYHWYPPLLTSNRPIEDYATHFFDRDHAEYLRAVDARFAGSDHSREFVARHFARAAATQPIDKALHLDATIMLVEDPVKRVDNMSMAWGLEARVPFLDHHVVELAARIPPSLKVAGGGKGILKSVARDILPNEVIDRPKGYFPVPALKYVDGPVLEFARQILHSDRAQERRLFDREYVDQLLAHPSDHITPLRGSKLWQLTVLEYWLQLHEI